jgi:hypothetical protein
MGYPTGEKKQWCSCCKIQGILCERINMHKVTCVVERHYDHYQATNKIYGFDTLQVTIEILQVSGDLTHTYSASQIAISRVNTGSKIEP